MNFRLGGMSIFLKVLVIANCLVFGALFAFVVLMGFVSPGESARFKETFGQEVPSGFFLSSTNRTEHFYLSNPFEGLTVDLFVLPKESKLLSVSSENAAEIINRYVSNDPETHYAAVGFGSLSLKNGKTIPTLFVEEGYTFTRQIVVNDYEGVRIDTRRYMDRYKDVNYELSQKNVVTIVSHRGQNLLIVLKGPNRQWFRNAQATYDDLSTLLVDFMTQSGLDS